MHRPFENIITTFWGMEMRESTSHWVPVLDDGQASISQGMRPCVCNLRCYLERTMQRPPTLMRYGIAFARIGTDGTMVHLSLPVMYVVYLRVRKGFSSSCKRRLKGQ